MSRKAGIIMPKKAREIKEGIQKTLNLPKKEKKYNYFTKQYDEVVT